LGRQITESAPWPLIHGRPMNISSGWIIFARSFWKAGLPLARSINGRRVWRL